MSATLLAAAGPSPLWYLTRGTGLVALLLLSGSVVLGIVTSARWSSRSWPRFVNAELHRWVALLVLAVLAAHIVTAELDTYAPVGWLAVVVPFASAYRAAWLGLGTLAFDLLLALVVTSLLRARLGFRTWRAVHWAAYACWPAAVVHGLGTGSDARIGWVQALTVACVAAVVTAVGARLAHDWRSAPAGRLGAAVAVAAAVALVTAWALAGPLRAGWSRRAGTPAALLATTAPTALRPATSAPGPAAPTRPPARSGQGPTGFTDHLAGALHQRGDAGGAVTVTISTRLSGPAPGTLVVVLHGRAAGGGVALSSSAVDLRLGRPARSYRGSVDALSGDQLAATVDAPGGTTLQLAVVLGVDPATGRVDGTVTARPEPG